MLKKPFISWIIPVSHSEIWLSRCLNSIQNQTYENWELIFWDNNSSDNSAKIINSFNDKRIKYFKSKPSWQKKK